MRKVLTTVIVKRMISVIILATMLLGVNFSVYADSGKEPENTRRKLITTWIWDGEPSKGSDGSIYESDIKTIVFKEMEDESDLMYSFLHDLSKDLFGMTGIFELTDTKQGLFYKYCPSQLDVMAEPVEFSNFYFYGKTVSNPSHYMTEITWDSAFGKDMDHLEVSLVSAFLISDNSLLVCFAYSNENTVSRVDFVFNRIDSVNQNNADSGRNNGFISSDVLNPVTESYLLGYWTSRNGMYTFEMKKDWSYYTMVPVVPQCGDTYDLVDGILYQYYARNPSKKTANLKFTAVSDTEMEVYSYQTKDTYTLFKRR